MKSGQSEEKTEILSSNQKRRRECQYSPPLEYSPLIGPSPSGRRKYPGQREKGSREAVVACGAADTDVQVSTVICNLHGSSLLPKGRAKECKNIKCPNKTFEDICDQQR